MINIPTIVGVSALLARSKAAVATSFFVDPNSGSDSAVGTSPSAPFRTLHRVADTIAFSRSNSTRQTVHLLPGVYELDKPIVLDERHSNTVWRKAVGSKRAGTVRVRGGYKINPSLFKPWNDHTEIFVAPIDQAAGDLGGLQSGALGTCSNSKAEVFFDGEPLILARYPNIDAQSGKWQWEKIRNVTSATTFVFHGNRPIENDWASASNLWLHGYWQYDWADNYVKVGSIDTEAHSYRIDANASQILYKLTSGARYYAVNLLQELDDPGEYYIDVQRRLLFVYPPSNITNGTDIVVSTIENLVTARQVSNLTFAGLDFSISRGTALSFTTVDGVKVLGGSVTNAGGNNSAIEFSNATNSDILGVTIERCSCGGIRIEGGNRRTLTPSGITIRRNRISNYARWKRTYMPGIWFDGCGHVISGNVIFDAPHEGISGHGDDCLIDGNHLHDLCYEGVDAGAFYAGRSWADRGNVVQNNLFERIRTTENAALGYSHVQAMYLDDQMSGYSLINNTVLDSDTGILLGGGRDNRFIGNRFIRTDIPLSFDNRGLSWMSENCKVGGSFQVELDKYQYEQPPWSTRYPQLTGTFDDRPCTPVHNTIRGFAFCGVEGGKSWIQTPGTSMEQLVLWDNLFANITEDSSLCNSSLARYVTSRDSYLEKDAGEEIEFDIELIFKELSGM